MRKGRVPLNIFVVFFTITCIIFSLSYFGRLSFINSILEQFVIPIQRTIIPGKTFFSEGENKLLAKEQEIAQKIVNQAVLEKEMKALRDQFMTTSPTSSRLIPAKVIGAPGMIPGVTLPEYLIVDKGLNDSVRVGQAVVFKDNLVGKIERTTDYLSRIVLTTSIKFSSTAKIINNDGQSPVGVGKGKGGGRMVLENVLLSDKIQEGDIVVTGGEKDINGSGIAPDLLLGKIVTIEKNPSALFQSASIQTLVDPTELSLVFILVN